jgi:hypothetical protein
MRLRVLADLRARGVLSPALEWMAAADDVPVSVH